MTFPDAAKVMPAARPARRRMQAFNAAIRSIGERHGMLIADLDRHGVIDARLWAIDRLHANTAGHVRIAAAMEQALGPRARRRIPGRCCPLPTPLPGRPSGGARPCGSASTPCRGSMRRMRGRSSGDGRSAKRPVLAPVVLTKHDAAAEPI